MAYFTIDNIYVASPCDVPWSSMDGNSTVRHCGDCKKNVYNLSLLTREEANQLLYEKEGKLCVRLYKRFDGTVLTADCPKGLRMMRKQYLMTRARVLTMAAGLFGFLGMCASSCMGVPADRTRVHVQDSTTHNFPSDTTNHK